MYVESHSLYVIEVAYMKSRICFLSVYLFFSSFIYSSLTPLYADEHSFKLGIIAPLSGDYASYGTLIRQGVELAKREIKKEGMSVKSGYRLEFL